MRKVPSQWLPASRTPAKPSAAHELNPELARDEAVVEGNLEEVKDEETGDRKVDEGTGG